MDGAEQTRALERARLLERRGATQEAIKAYLNLGLPEDAVRAAASVGRFLEAARMALAHVPAQQDLGSLEGSPRRLAHRAALLLLEAGEHREALQLLLALGEREQARAAAERLGNVQITNFSGPGAPTMPPAGALAARARALEIDSHAEAARAAYLVLQKYGDSARMALQLGRGEEAAALYEQAGMLLEAARCYQQAGATERAGELRLRLPLTHAGYREACVEVLADATRRGALSARQGRWLAAFLESDPVGAEERRAFEQAAALLEAHGQRDAAEELRARLA
jgi:hypothetical protein